MLSILEKYKETNAGQNVQQTALIIKGMEFSFKIPFESALSNLPTKKDIKKERKKENKEKKKKKKERKKKREKERKTKERKKERN